MRLSFRSPGKCTPLKFSRLDEIDSHCANPLYLRLLKVSIKVHAVSVTAPEWGRSAVISPARSEYESMKYRCGCCSMDGVKPYMTDGLFMIVLE